jgi:hypothetical protein
MQNLGFSHGRDGLFPKLGTKKIEGLAGHLLGFHQNVFK